jgi:hypothetical protein
VDDHSYPGYQRPSTSDDLDHAEVAWKVAKTINTVTRLGDAYVSPNFFGQSDTDVYLKGGAATATLLEFRISDVSAISK